MKTVLTKLKAFFNNEIVKSILEVVVILTFIVSYVFLWVAKPWLMLIMHVSAGLSLWALITELNEAEKEQDNTNV